MTTRILVVDDVQVIRGALRLYLEQQAGWLVCGEAENGVSAIEQVRKLRPDVVLLDLSMPVMNGLDAARAIKAIAPSTRILMFTMHTYPQLLDEAKKVGIENVISKGERTSDILHAIRSLLAA